METALAHSEMPCAASTGREGLRGKWVQKEFNEGSKRRMPETTIQLQRAGPDRHTGNPTIWEVEAGGSRLAWATWWVWGQLGPHQTLTLTHSLSIQLYKAEWDRERMRAGKATQIPRYKLQWEDLRMPWNRICDPNIRNKREGRPRHKL